MIGDSSPRTKKIRGSAIQIIIATVLIFTGIIGVIIGKSNYNQVLAQSSHPINTVLKFQRSQAEIKIADIYTDTNKDVLIVRFSVPAESSNRIPYKGNDYKVYMASKSLKGYKEATILFGKMSTDGDMFLVIPRPTNDVYSIFIMNTKYISTNYGESSTNSLPDDISTSDNTNDDEIKTSISKSLSSYQYSEGDASKSSYNILTDYADMIQFRLTMDPAIKKPGFMPKVLDAELISKDNEFDFEKFFNVVFKESAVKILKDQHKDLNKQVAQSQTAKNELVARIAENPNDQDAINALKSIETTNNQLEQQQTDLARKISQYENLRYTSNLFTNLQTKATIVD